jgi:hypothetical protein
MMMQNRLRIFNDQIKVSIDSALSCLIGPIQNTPYSVAYIMWDTEMDKPQTM